MPRAQPDHGRSSLIVASPVPLEHLPYDLWQRGHRVDLALYRLLPNLDYPTIRQLAIQQRSQLLAAVGRNPVPRPLSPRATDRYVLVNVFGCDLAQLQQPGQLIRWLDDLYAGGDSLPPHFAAAVAAELHTRPAFSELPLADLLANVDAFRTWLQADWDAYVRTQLHEYAADYAGSPALPPRLFVQPDPTLRSVLPRSRAPRLPYPRSR